MKILLAAPDFKDLPNFLASKGHEVTVATDLKIALASFLRCSHEAVVVHFPQAEEDSSRLIRILRGQDAGKSARVVAIGETDTESRFLADGADAALFPGSSPEEVLGALESDGEASGGAGGAMEEEPINRAAAIKLVDGDEELFQEIVEMFFVDVDPYYGQLMEAFAREDAAEIEKMAHTLKGAASNICAVSFKDAAARIERAARNRDVPSARKYLAPFQAEYDRLKAYLKRLLQK